MPYADGIFPAWRKETNYFINAKPQIASLNVGAWRVLELSIRKEAIALMQTMIILLLDFNKIFTIFNTFTSNYKSYLFKIKLKKAFLFSVVMSNNNNFINLFLIKNLFIFSTKT